LREEEGTVVLGVGKSDYRGEPMLEDSLTALEPWLPRGWYS
jgi:hypothetical protein